MKTLLSATLTAFILAATLRAADDRGGISVPNIPVDFNARVAYAKDHGTPVKFSGKPGMLAGTAYIVKHGAGNTAGYTLIIGTNSHSKDSLVVICDKAVIDPSHSIKCSGHVIETMNGFWCVDPPDGLESPSLLLSLELP